MQLKIDPEFRDEIPPLEPGELQLLEASIMADGCRDPLVVWDEENILVDGHHRLTICQQHNVPYTIVRKSFESRLHALIWMHQNQAGRRNVTKYYASTQALKMAARLVDLGKQAMSDGAIKARSNGDNNNGFSEMKNHAEIDAWEEAAKTYSTSKGSMSNAKLINGDDATEEIKQAAKDGNISLTRAAEITKIIKALPEQDRALAFALCGDSTGKARVLVRLHKSAGSPTTNGTYHEIIATGGFHFGVDFAQWCDFANASLEEIEIGIDAIVTEHRRIAFEARRAEMQANRITAYPGPGFCGVIHGDMREVGLQIADNSIDLIFTDPPYPEEFLPLYSELSRLAARVLKPGGVCLAYSGTIHLPEAITRLSEALEYAWVCAVRHTGGSPRMFKVNLNTGWKPVLMFVKPPLKPYWDSFFDITSGGKEKSDHEWQQAEGEAAHFIQALCPSGGTVLDPFCGSGTTLAAAKALKRGYVGIEIDIDHVATVETRLNDTTEL